AQTSPLSLHDALPISEDLDDPFQLALTAHQWVELGIHRSLGQVAGKLTEQGGFALALRLRLLLTGAGQFFADRGKAETPLVQNRSEEHTSELQSPCNV